MKMTKNILAAAVVLAAAFVSAETVEIRVDIKMDCPDYVAGERVRAVVDVANASPDTISVGYADSPDRFLIEVYRSNGRVQLEKVGKGAFVSSFTVGANEGQKLETFLGDNYYLREPGSYLVKPVLVHNGSRFEGQTRAFNVVPGMKIATALQMFSNREGLRREFELLSWNRKNVEHLFLAAYDTGSGTRRWTTTDLGPSIRLEKPTVTILPGGEVIVLHRYDRDYFCRTEFWSLPDVFVYQKREIVRDPATAGSERIRELYKESGGVKPKETPWWKFW